MQVSVTWSRTKDQFENPWHDLLAGQALLLTLGSWGGGLGWVVVSCVKIKITACGNTHPFLQLPPPNESWQSFESCHKFPQMTSVNQNLPWRMCGAAGILCGWIISLAWLVPSFVCLPELFAKVKAGVSLSTWDLLCAAEIAPSILTPWLGLQKGVNSLWFKWIDKSQATIGMFRGINFLENLQIDSNYSRFLYSLFLFF